MPLRARMIGVIGSAALSALCGAAAQTDGFEAVLADSFDDLGVPGLGYAIVEDGQIAAAGGLGVADAAEGTPVTARTPFRLASLTKPVSAALLLDAVQSGDADLDRPLREASSRFDKACRPMRAYFKLNGLPYLDDVACGTDAILVRHVLTHTATTPPGTAFRYNGFLFGLLSDEIGDVTVGGGDDNFVRAVRGRVIEPLALRDAAAGITDGEAGAVVERLAKPHERDGESWAVLPPLTDPLNAGAGLIASAADLGAIDVAYRGRVMTEPASWTLATTPATLSDGTVSPYGMGWFVQEIGGRDVLWHYGHQPGAYSGLWVRDEGNGRSLVALANGDGLAAGLALHQGDLTRSALATAFLDWSASRGPAAP